MDTSAALTALKRDPDRAWLNEVASVQVQQALKHLDTAFKNFFEHRAKYPVFKRKQESLFAMRGISYLESMEGSQHIMARTPVNKAFLGFRKSMRKRACML
jgi:transposase